MEFSKKEKGFALIELMVVLAVCSVIAAIFAPRFLKNQIHKKQEECHRNLKSLYAAEKDHFKKNNVFTSNLNELIWEARGKEWHQYRFLPTPPPKNGFLFQCLGNIDKDSTLDQATIDETGQITQISDDLKK